MGNLRSVEKAVERVGSEAVITADPGTVESADGVILPGVGAFPKAMEEITGSGMDRLIAERVEAGVPVLGICLGLQLLFDGSEELGGAEGLGLIPGRVVGVPSGGRKVPHIGWAEVTWKSASPLVDGLRQGEPFYFVHSFVAVPAPEDVIGEAAYGGPFACVAGRGSIWGVQFHPEKSSAAGIRLLANFASICEPVPGP